MFRNRETGEVMWQASQDRNGWVEIDLGRLGEFEQGEEYECGTH